MDDQEHLQRIALDECNVAFVNKLDVNAILPHLIAYHLLTNDDRQVLMMYAKTQVEKAQYLLDILPRKSKGWFEQFLDCLRQSSEGTGHDDLVNDLEMKYQELTEQNNVKKSKKKVFKLGGEPSPVEKPQQPVCGRQTEDYGEYTIFLESSGSHSTHTFRVKSSETVDGLMKKVHKKLNIGHFHRIRLIAGAQELMSERSLMDSGIGKNSRVALVIITHGGCLLECK